MILINEQMTRKSSLIANKNHSLDWFIKKKNMEAVNQKWLLKEAALKIPISEINEKKYDKTKTENLIVKMKTYFRENYSSSLDFVNFGKRTSKKENVIDEVDKDAQEISLQSFDLEAGNVSDDTLKQDSLSIFKEPSQELTSNSNTNSLYMKKLRNNYYDRKLWNSLNLSKELNVTIDNRIRDYNNEFNILQPYKANNMGSFKDYIENYTAKIRKPEYKTEELIISNSKENENSKISRFQKIVLSKSNGDRNINLIKILEYMPVIILHLDFYVL